MVKKRGIPRPPVKSAVHKRAELKSGPDAVVAMVNLKGGVGKTALAVNFAAYCGMRGLKTLLIDLDPQTNATLWCLSFDEWEDRAAKNGTVANLLGVRSHASAEGAEKKAADVLVPKVFRNVDLIPSHLDLFSVDLDLASVTSRETRLRRAIAPILPDYRVIVCDCPPNLTIPTQNALAVSTHYITPVSPDYLSAIGVGLLHNRIKELSDALERQLVNAGIVIGRIGRSSVHREQTQAAIRQQFGDNVLTSEIKERSAVSEAAESHQSVFERANSMAADDFRAVCSEILTRIGIIP